MAIYPRLDLIAQRTQFGDDSLILWCVDNIGGSDQSESSETTGTSRASGSLTKTFSLPRVSWTIPANAPIFVVLYIARTQNASYCVIDDVDVSLSKYDYGTSSWSDFLTINKDLDSSADVRTFVRESLSSSQDLNGYGFGLKITVTYHTTDASYGVKVAIKHSRGNPETYLILPVEV